MSKATYNTIDLKQVPFHNELYKNHTHVPGAQNYLRSTRS